MLEVWNYAPLVLAERERECECVDALSLHLSVRDEPEARVQQAATRLLERIQW